MLPFPTPKNFNKKNLAEGDNCGRMYIRPYIIYFIYILYFTSYIIFKQKRKTYYLEKSRKGWFCLGRYFGSIFSTFPIVDKGRISVDYLLFRKLKYIKKAPLNIKKFDVDN